METDKIERIKILKQKTKIQNLLPNFIDSLNKLTDSKLIHADLLNIDEMYNIVNKIKDFHSKNPSYLSICFPYEYQDKFQKIVSFYNDLNNKNQYFTTSKFHNDLIFNINTKSIIKGYDKIIEIDSDGFYIYDSEINNGVKFQPDEEHWEVKEKYTWTYELKIWGNQWIDLIYNEYKRMINK